MTKSRYPARILLTAALFIELLLLSSLVCMIATGGVPETLRQLIWSVGMVAGISGIAAFGLPESWARRASLHGALIAGSVIFALPFVWLVSTSFKYPEETFVYPPQWLPQVPLASKVSPFLDPRGVPGLELDPAASARLWDLAQRHIAAAELDSVDPTRARIAVTAQLADRLGLGSDTPPGGQTFSDARVNAELVRDVWSDLYRRVVLGPITIYDRDRLAHPLPRDAVKWEVEPPNGIARVSPATQGPSGTAVTYRFGPGEDSFRLIGSVDPAALPERPVLSFALSMRQDRSWHAIETAVIHHGQRLSTTDRLSLSDDGYRELTFKFQHRDGLDERKLGVYPLVPDQGDVVSDSTDRAGELARIEITVTRRSPFGATWAKYTQAYFDAWYADNHWPRYLFNSLLLVVLSVVGQLLSCSMVAYAFSRLRWAGREFLFGVVLATMMLPAMVMMIPAFMIFKTAGLYNTLVPLWLPAFFGTPFFIFLLRQFMLAIPRDLEEAALIDGCSWYGIYWRIILPLMKPALAAVAIFTFMNVWNEFMGPLIYLSDARKFPLSLGLFNFRSENDSNFAMLMAASTMMTLPVIMLFFFCQRYFIEGVTLTGVKG